LIMPALLAILSIIMMLSTSYDNGIVISREVIVQSVAYALGIIFVVIIINIDYSFFPDIEKWLYIGSVVLLLLVYLPVIGVEHNGARSWINLGFMDFQPSEIVKITFILLFANYLTKHRGTLHSFKGLGMAFLYSLPFILIVTKEDLGSGLVFLSMWIVMVFYAGLDYRILARCAAMVAVLTPFVYRFMASHQKERIDAFLHPGNLSLQGNYQVYQSKVAIGSGGLFGKGLFHGTQKNLSYLPVSNSDFIYSVICEELGFLGGAAVIVIYGWFIFSVTKTAHGCKDTYGKFIIIGIVGMLTFQIFENIAMTMGIMPVTGITLPFLSYGGSGIISNMIALGFILNVAVKNRELQF
jgi:rod shape determining protein RodA